MARVVNQLIDVVLAGPARVKQYSGTGPLLVKLPGDRGELRVASGDYLCYDGEAVVGSVGGPYLDALREDKDTLVEEEVSTGAHVRVILLNAESAPLPNEPASLKQAGEQLATGMTNKDGEVYFNTLPGTYTVGPTNPARGPEIEVVAVVGEEAPPEPPPVSDAMRGGQGQAGRPHPDNSLPGRFDVMGNPDPKGNYNSRGELLDAGSR